MAWHVVSCRVVCRVMSCCVMSCRIVSYRIVCVGVRVCVDAMRMCDV